RIPRQWLRTLRHDRQCLGVDRERLCLAARRRRKAILLPAEEKQRPHRKQGGEGWFTPLRAELLPALSPRRAAEPATRYLDHPHRVSLCRSLESVWSRFSHDS